MNLQSAEREHVTYYGYRYYDPVTGRWPSRDPIGEEFFFTHYTMTSSAEEKNKLKEKSLDPSYLFIDNNPTNNYDIMGLRPSDTWMSCYRGFRLQSKFGPKKACDETNSKLGQSEPCSSLGFQKEPSLTWGLNPKAILKDAEWLRNTGDGDLGGVTPGADKLAHCYAFCVVTSWYWTPFVTYHALNLIAGMNSDSQEDVDANMEGYYLGRNHAIFWRPRVTMCLKSCASKTYDMNFN